MTRHARVPTTSSTPIEGSTSQVPDSITTGTTQQSTNSQSDETTFATEIVRQIEAVFESFRTKTIKKLQAIFEIGQILATDSGGDDQVKLDSLEHYAATLNGIEVLSSQSDSHGARMSATMLGKRKEGHDRGGRGPEELVGDNPTDFQDDVDSFIRELSNENVGVGLEANDEEIESDGEGDHGYDTGNESGE
jgi:hypothetical protein